ncbi:MAG: ABC transporter ATP-binding protein [Bacteroidales bacterium]|nr:ABC transporter ATP-binding protein [Bacteroidales bacterium]
MKTSGKKNGKNTSGIFRVLKPYRSLIAVLVLFTMVGNGANLVIPTIIANGIDAFNAGDYTWRPFAIRFLTVSVLIFLFTYLQSIVQAYTSERVARDLRKKLSEKLSTRSYSYILKIGPSRLLTNLTSDMDSVKMFVAQAVSSIVSSLIVILGTSILLIQINWKLGLTVIGMIPLIAVSFFIVLKKVQVLFKKSREVVDWLNKVINESILGAAIIRVINSQQQEYAKFIAASKSAKDVGIAILTLFATLIPIITFVANLATLAILAQGGHYVISGTLSIGDFTAFNSYVAMLIFPIIVIGFMSNLIAQASASYQRIDLVLQAPDTLKPGSVESLLKGNIELKNIHLSYDSKPVLKDVSFKIPGGSRTAILGPTAAGKTQLLNLMTGLVAADSGTIEFEGVGLEQYRKKKFHEQIGLVFQDSIMFNMSIRENIAFSDKVTDESLQKAIDTAELNDFVQTLPAKLDTRISERGTSLSGGQKQRIMLARALAMDPKVLLLDDFTARIDRKTEYKIQCNLLNNYPDMTIISITQKISAIKDFDLIIVLMEGEVIAQGKHPDLLGSCPEYVQIYNSQKSTSHYEL